MATMTMPTVVERTQPKQKSGESQLLPLLLAMALLVASGVLAVLISGPMH